jgi:hypothetical protein
MTETPNPTVDATLPRSDLMSSLGKEMSVYFRQSPDLAALKFPMEENGSLKARLVGFDRQGVWLEPTQVREECLSKQAPVPHYFLAWDLILSMARQVEVESFIVKREYRGLRPQV